MTEEDEIDIEEIREEIRPDEPIEMPVTIDDAQHHLSEVIRYCERMQWPHLRTKAIILYNDITLGYEEEKETEE